MQLEFSKSEVETWKVKTTFSEFQHITARTQRRHYLSDFYPKNKIELRKLLNWKYLVLLK